MKLRTKLIISFCIIIFVPVTLAALAMCGFRYFQLRDIANTYQVEDGNISYLTNTVQMWNRVTRTVVRSYWIQRKATRTNSWT